MFKRIVALLTLLGAVTLSAQALACPGDKAKSTGEDKQQSKPKTSLFEQRG